jgi:transposase
MLRSRTDGAELALAGSRMEPDCRLTDEQWQLISDLFPEHEYRPSGGRPIADSRACVEGILWVLKSGARWRDLPKHFPSPSTCWRRHGAWTRNGIWAQAWSRLLRLLKQQGLLKLDEALADGTFSPAKKGALVSARPNEAKGPRSWFWPMEMVCQRAS